MEPLPSLELGASSLQDSRSTKDELEWHWWSQADLNCRIRLRRPVLCPGSAMGPNGTPTRVRAGDFRFRKPRFFPELWGRGLVDREVSMLIPRDQRSALPLELPIRGMVPGVGIEPTTPGFSVLCSTL